MDVSEGGAGPLRVTITGPHNMDIHPNVEYNEEEKIYTYQYTPGEEGEYVITILWCGKSIPNSPYTVKVAGSKRPRAATLGRQAMASLQYKVYGPGIEAKDLCALAPAEFWVEGVQSGANLQVKISGPKGILGSSGFAIEIIQKGKFSVIYRPPVAGKYKIEIMVAGRVIASSPYTVEIGAQKDLIGWAKGPGVEGIHLQTRNPTWFRVFTPTASSRDITVAIEGPAGNVGASQVKVIDSVFTYAYTPKHDGKYSIIVAIGPKKNPTVLSFVVTVPSTILSGPCKIWGAGIASRGIQVNKKVTVYVQPVTKTDEKPSIGFAIAGPDGDIPYTEEESLDDVHTYHYEPQKVGRYTISVLFQGTPVPDSPFTVNVTDITKVIVTGTGVNGEAVPINKTLCLAVNAKDAGLGELQCKLLPIDQKEANKYPVEMTPSIKDTGNETSEIKFTPALACQPFLAITFDDLPVPQSPLKFNVIDTGDIKVYGRGITNGNIIGKRTYFMVDTSKAVSGELVVTVDGPDTTIPIHLSDDGKGIVKCDYTPEVEGTYIANITYSGLPVQHSPFHFEVLPIDEAQVIAVYSQDVEAGLPLDESQIVSVYGPGVEAGLLVGSSTEFFIDKGDTPLANIDVKVESPSTEVKTKMEPIDEKITKCYFKVQEYGTYKIDVKTDGKPIPGSPFKNNSSFPEGMPKVTATGEGLEKAYVNEWAKFDLDFTQAGQGSLDVSVDGPGRAETRIEGGTNGKASVKYLPPISGEYTINISFGKDIPGSPFIVNAVPREAEDTITEVVQLEAEGVKLGSVFTYMVDTSGSEDKQSLSGRIVGPYKKINFIPKELLSDTITLDGLPRLLVGKRAIEPTVTEKEKIYTVQFTPTEIGVYLLYIFLDDHLAPQMPYEIYVCDPTKVRISGCGLNETEGNSYPVNDPLNWEADCIHAGPGKLKAYCAGPQNCSKHFEVTPLPNEDCYTISYIPDVPGSYQVLFAYNGYDLSDKPKLMIGDSSKARVQISDTKFCLVREEVSFCVDLSAAGAGKLQANIEGPVEVPINYAKNKNGTCNFSFIPTEPGKYTLSVSFGNKLITDEPFEVTAISPEEVLVTGSGVTGKGACVGKPVNVTIDCTNSGIAPLEATITTPDEKAYPLQLIPITDESIFEAEYLPENPGYYQLDLTLADKPVKGSPFKVPIAKPEEVMVSPTTPVFAKPDEICKLDCFTEQAGPGILTASLFDPNDKTRKPLEAKVTSLKDKDGHYEVAMKVPGPGLYKAEIYYNEVPVGKPIDIITANPPNCSVDGPGINPKVAVGRDTYFTVDTSKAGNGNISTTIQTPDESVLPTQITKTEDGVFTVNYTPEILGEYIIDVYYDAIPLAESPYKTTCIDTTSMALQPTGSQKVKIGEPIEFIADLSKCTDGDFNVALTGPEECPINHKDDNGTSTFSFTPTTAGVYEIYGVFDDLPVSEKPLVVSAIDPEKVLVAGPGVTGKGAKVGEPVEVIVDTTESGPAPVGGVLTKPSGEKDTLDFKPNEEENPDILVASYTPETSGDYVTDITFDNEPVSESPFTAHIISPDEVRFEGTGIEEAAIGQENIIDLFMPKIVPEEVTMEMMTPDHQEIPLDFFVDLVDEDHCQIKYSPEKEGVYEAVLCYSGTPLGEPLSIAVGNPLNCKVDGPGVDEDKLPVGQETYLTVDTTEAGPGKPKVLVTGPKDTEVESKCEEEKPGVFKFTYAPQIGGTHEIAVLYDGHHVPESPYTIPVFSPAGVKCIPVNPEKKIHPGETIELNVDLRDAGEGEFGLGIEGPGQRPIISEEAFIALLPLDQIDGNTEVIQLQPEGLKTGNDFQYNLDTSEVTTGDEISGKIVGPYKNSKQIPNDLLSDHITLNSLPSVLKGETPLEPKVSEDNKIYNITFTPEDVGIYLLYVFLGDNLVNDMPCKITVCDPTKVKIKGVGLDDTEDNTCPVGKSIIWEADCKRAGPGTLKAYCAGPDNCTKTFKVSPIPNEEDCYKVKYTPKVPGPYQILFAYGGYEVPGKPSLVAVDTKMAILRGKVTEDGTVKPLEGKIEQKQNDDGTYTFLFTPTEPGLYTIAPTLCDEPIFEEPLSIPVTDIEKVVVTGPGVTGKGAKVGEPVEVIVDTTESGPAPVGGVLTKPSGEKDTLDFKPNEEENPDILVASYTPETSGDYVTNITFDNEPISESPFTAHIISPDEVRFEGTGIEEAAIGQENIIDLFMPKIVPEEVTMEMMTPDHHEIPLDFFVNMVDEDHCQIKYSPEKEGVYEAVLCYSGTPLGEPLSIAVGNPLNCKVDGPGVDEDKLPVGQETYLTVDTTEAGPGKPKVLVTGPKDTEVESKCEEEKPGVFKFTYTPQVGGTHEIAVLYDGHHVPESPYTIPVFSPAGVKCIPVNPEKKIHPGETIELNVDLSDAGEGEFGLGIEGPGQRPIISEEAFIALLPLDQIDGNTEVIQLQPEGLKTGNDFQYNLDTSEVTTGDEISGKIVGPYKNSKQIPNDLLSDQITLNSLPSVLKGETPLEPKVSEDNKIYNITFTPEDVGIYLLYVFLGDNLVNDMPCKITVCDPTKVKIKGVGLDDTEDNTCPVGKSIIWEADCKRAGPGTLKAYCAGPDNCTKTFKVSPIPNEEDCYKVKYTPKVPGPYQILFAYGGYEVPGKPSLVAVDTKMAILRGKVTEDGTVKPLEGKIEQKQNDDGTYTFLFTPTEPGLYTIAPTLCDEPIFEEPLSIPVTDIEKVVVSGPGVTGKGAKVGEPVEVIVDTTESGPAPVGGVLTKPSGEKDTLDFKPNEEESPDILRSKYTPEACGYHTLELSFDDQMLPQNPIQVYIVNPEESKLKGEGVEEAIFGEVNIIECFLENSPDDGEFSMMIENEGELVPLECEAVKIDKDNWKVEYTPDEAEFVILYFNEVQISEKIPIAATDVSGCIVEGIGNGDGLIIDEEKSFTVDVNAIPTDGELALFITQSDGSEIEATINEVESKIFNIIFTPTVLGLLKLTLRYAGGMVSGGPFNLYVVDPSAVVCTGIDGESKLVDEKLVFAVDASAAGMGAELKVSIEGPGECSVSCEHVSDNQYSGVMSTIYPGVYLLHVFYGGIEIQGSPFICPFHRSEPDATKCSVSDIENPGKFMVDCRHAGGNGILEVAVYGSYVPARYIAVEHNGNFTFNVTYDIPDPVETVISVKWHGEHLKGSPFKVVFNK